MMDILHPIYIDNKKLNNMYILSSCSRTYILSIRRKKNKKKSPSTIFVRLFGALNPNSICISFLFSPPAIFMDDGKHSRSPNGS